MAITRSCYERHTGQIREDKLTRSSLGHLPLLGRWVNHLSLLFNSFSISSTEGSTDWMSLGSCCLANLYLDIPIGALIRNYKIAFRNHRQVADKLRHSNHRQVADDSQITGNITGKCIWYISDL